MSIEAAPRLFTVEDYHAMVRAGIIAEGERVELLDGRIFEMSPIGVGHWVLHGRIVRYLNDRLGDLAFVAGQASFPLDHRSEPQPDIAILAPLPYDQRPQGPSGTEFYGLIEIAQSSLSTDLGFKARLYARTGIRDYVVVDLDRKLIVHHAHFEGDRYTRVERVSGGTVTLAALPDHPLDVTAFLPPP